MHCRMFSSVPGLYPLDASSTTLIAAPSSDNLDGIGRNRAAQGGEPPISLTLSLAALGFVLRDTGKSCPPLCAHRSLLSSREPLSHSRAFSWDPRKAEE